MGLSRSLKNTYKKCLRKGFELGQHVGFDVLPRHFYSSIPDIREMKADRHWQKPMSLYGVNGADLDTQMAFARRCLEGLYDRLKKNDIYPAACKENGEPGYGPTEAEFLHCFIKHTKPRRIVQVGAGVSTSLIMTAAKEVNHLVEITAVDPFPSALLQRASGDGRIKLVPEPAQKVAIETYTSLGAGDLLFIDSTHAVKPGSEVNRLILEVLPRMNKGVLVHFHDIMFPYDYNPSVLSSLLFFSLETALLAALLINNPRYNILASLAMLHHGRQDQLKQLMPNYAPTPMQDGLYPPGSEAGHMPSSIFLEVIS